MTVYLILLAAAAAIGIPLCGIAENKKGLQCTIYCGVLALILAIVSAVRLSVGHDYNLYASVFYELNFMDYTDIGYDQWENGFMFPAKIINTVTTDFVWLFVIMSAALYPILMTYIRKFSDNPWISVFAFISLGVYFNSLNFMRQFIGAVICAYALTYANKGKFGRFAVFVLLAVSVHRSSLIFLPCYLLAYIEWNYIVLIVCGIMTVLAYFTSGTILEFTTKYVYTYYNPETSAELINGLPIWYTVMFGALFAAGFLLRKRLKGCKGEINSLLWCAFGTFFFELLGSSHAIIARFALIFCIPAVTLLVPKIFIALHILMKERFPKAGGILTAVVFISVCTFNCYSLLDRNYNGVVPYKTIFETEDGGNGQQ